MITYKSSYIPINEKDKFFYQEWLPEKTPKAIILFIHGLGSHSSRLDHWAKRFAENGIAFAGYDQYGNGKSDGKRGYPIHMKYFVKDMDIVIDIVRERHPKIPLIIYGHSMGASEVINYSIKYPNKIDGCIASSPWLGGAQLPSKIVVVTVQILKTIIPWIIISNGLNRDDLSRDPEEVKKYREDPLVHDRVSIGLGTSFVNNVNNTMKQVNSINCPFLIMHGTADKITSHKSSEKLCKAANDNCTLKLWENAFHELHHEPIRDQVFKYLLSWLKSNMLV